MVVFMTESDARLAELLGALSLACDTAYGFPPEKVMRGAVLSVELGRVHGLPDSVLRDAYYASVLGYAGCAAFAHEEAHYNEGDDIGFRNALANALSDASPSAMPRFVRKVGKGAGFVRRSRAVARLLLDMNSTGDRHARSICDTSERFAGRPRYV